MNDWIIQTKATIANGLLIASGELAIGLLACYFILMVRFFRHRESAIGVLCLLCLLLGGGGLVLGIPIALLFGWLRARRWKMLIFMVVFTGLYFFVVTNFALAFFVQRGTTREQWANWFGTTEIREESFAPPTIPLIVEDSGL